MSKIANAPNIEFLQNTNVRFITKSVCLVGKNELVFKMGNFSNKVIENFLYLKKI